MPGLSNTDKNQCLSTLGPSTRSWHQQQVPLPKRRAPNLPTYSFLSSKIEVVWAGNKYRLGEAQNLRINTDRHRHETETVTDTHQHRQTDTDRQRQQTDSDRLRQTPTETDTDRHRETHADTLDLFLRLSTVFKGLELDI